MIFRSMGACGGVIVNQVLRGRSLNLTNWIKNGTRHATVVSDLEFVEDFGCVVIAWATSAHREIVSNQDVSGGIVSALRDPLGYGPEDDRALVWSSGRAGVGEKVPVPVLDGVRCDRPIAIDLPTYRHPVPLT